MSIKQENVKEENLPQSCRFRSNSQTDLQHSEPRISHPSGLDPKQLAILYKQPIKQEKNLCQVQGAYPNMSNSTNIPGPNQSTGQGTLLPSSTNITKEIRSSAGRLGNNQAFPVDWGDQSAQDFMAGDDSLQQSPSNQASGSGGASQQVGVFHIRFS